MEFDLEVQRVTVLSPEISFSRFRWALIPESTEQQTGLAISSSRVVGDKITRQGTSGHFLFVHGSSPRWICLAQHEIKEYPCLHRTNTVHILLGDWHDD